jgi:positive phototaxis protein PixI
MLGNSQSSSQGNSQSNSKVSSKKLAKSAINQSAEQFLAFSLTNSQTSNQQALLPAKQLLEIVNVNLSQITAIAGLSSPSVMGIYNWQGDVIWVVDLASMLGYKPLYAQEYSLGNFQDKCHIIFLRSQDTVLGFAVAKVWQMMRCDTSTIQTTNLGFANQAVMQACRGYWLSDKNETFLVLDGNAIAQIVSSR